MQKFDKATLKIIRDKMQKALDELGIEGVTAEVGNCRFDQNEATFKVNFKSAGAEKAQQQQLENVMKIYDIESKVSKDGKYTLVDYHPSKRKYPFIVEGVKGGQYKLSVDQVLSSFPMKAVQ